MKTRTVFLAVAILLLSGCAGSSKMLVLENQQLVAPTAEETQLVFLRSTFTGSAISASLYDVTDGNLDFIGILGNDSKIAYTVEPGKHTFMVVSEAADFMEADVAAGKTYYAMVTPRMGAWAARFSMHPVRNGREGNFQYSSERFQNWLKRTKFVQNTPESLAWFEGSRNSVESKQSKYWPVWQKKTPEALAERTLNPDDGV